MLAVVYVANVRRVLTTFSLLVVSQTEPGFHYLIGAGFLVPTVVGRTLWSGLNLNSRVIAPRKD